tara:strand:- start:2265 stop:2420 length:156 start_codon:yes stop_codon:yes gene_type:complete
MLGIFMLYEAALYITMRETRTNNSALAIKMGQLKDALALLGMRISVVVEAV